MDKLEKERNIESCGLWIHNDMLNNKKNFVKNNQLKKKGIKWRSC